MKAMLMFSDPNPPLRDMELEEQAREWLTSHAAVNTDRDRSTLGGHGQVQGSSTEGTKKCCQVFGAAQPRSPGRR